MPRFNEIDRYLLQCWSDARLLDDAMEKARKKYSAILDDLLKEIQRKYPQLGYSKKWFSRGDGTAIGIGKVEWPKNQYGSPNGLWFECLGLDNLCSQDSDRPWMHVWISHSNPKEIEQRLLKAKETVLGKEESQRWEIESDTTSTSLWRWLECPEELPGLLIKDEARDFIERMTKHFDSLAKFIPTVDDILGNRQRKRQS